MLIIDQDRQSRKPAEGNLARSVRSSAPSMSVTVSCDSRRRLSTVSRRRSRPARPRGSPALSRRIERDLEMAAEPKRRTKRNSRRKVRIDQRTGGSGGDEKFPGSPDSEAPSRTSWLRSKLKATFVSGLDRPVRRAAARRRSGARPQLRSGHAFSCRHALHDVANESWPVENPPGQWSPTGLPLPWMARIP